MNNQPDKYPNQYQAEKDKQVEAAVKEAEEKMIKLFLEYCAGFCDETVSLKDFLKSHNIKEG